MASKLIIEVCVDSVESALAAVRGGADRLELCANLGLGGGTTPSAGLLKVVQSAVNQTPIMVMVRPRTGDFLYSQPELEVMVEDIKTFKALGATGVVFGVLTCGGRVDIESTTRLVQQALPMQVCFHRAFDMTVDIREALMNIASIPGIIRILTSGHAKSAPSDDSELEEMMYDCGIRKKVPGSITLLAGSGINPATVKRVVKRLRPSGLREIHLTGGRWVEGNMWHRPEDMGMGVVGHEWSVWRTSEEAIMEVRLQVDGITKGGTL